jgi:KDO2-lipid IV(A) lauroyltransferase
MTFFQKRAYKIGAGFAAALWPFFRKRQRIAVENILKCRITDDESEAYRIAKASWCHLAGHVCEALCVPNVITKDNWREHLDVITDADKEVASLLLEKTDIPILLVSSHHGVWEVATNLISLSRPMIAIARVMNNKFVEKWMKKHHFRGPVTIVDKNNGFRKAVMNQWLDEKAAMTILIDQHTSKGEMLEFLGRKAKTFTSATRLAVRYGCPIVVGSFVRTGPYQYRLVGDAPLRFSKDDDIAKATQILNDRLSDAIRKYPEQYLWAHRRWRFD